MRRLQQSAARETRRWLTGTSEAKAMRRVRGTRDLLVDESQRHRDVINVLQRTVTRFGFRSVRC